MMKATVLCVEDDPVLQSLVKTALGTAGYGVSIAADGKELFDTLESGAAVDLVLLDLGLPDGDAMPHIMKLREDTDLPIVVMTARGRQDDRLMALGLGADDYLRKPIDVRELCLRVGNILARRNGSPRPRLGEVVGETPRATPMIAPPKRKRTSQVSAGTLAAFVLAAAAVGIGVYSGASSWIFESRSAPATAAATRGHADVAGRQPLPAPEPVAAGPKQPAGDGADKTRDSAPELAPLGSPAPTPTQKAAVLGYGWVLNTACGPVPDIEWWSEKTHEDMAHYVVRRKRGDWPAYIKDLKAWLATLYDLAERGAATVTRTGRKLEGAALGKYIQQSVARLAVARCLAAEAELAEAGGG